jgi:DNA polymerase-3 subunit chi
MPRIDFYVLSEDSPDATLRQACRIAELAFDRGERVFVRAPSPSLAQRLDDLLWSYSDRTFLPHELSTGGSASHERVMILVGVEVAPESHRQLLVNLADDIPGEADTCACIAEIVAVDPEKKKAARERFRVYRDRGYQLESHNL